MKAIVAVLVALFCVQAMEARVARSTDSAPSLEAALAQFRASLGNWTIPALPSGEEFKTQLQTYAQTIANNVQEAATAINAKAAELSGETQQALRTTAQNLEQEVQRLRQNFPDAAQGADKLKASLNGLVQETKRLQETLQPHADAAAQAVRTVATNLVEQATVVSNEAQRGLQRAANAH